MFSQKIQDILKICSFHNVTIPHYTKSGAINGAILLAREVFDFCFLIIEYKAQKWYLANESGYLISCCQSVAKDQ